MVSPDDDVDGGKIVHEALEAGALDANDPTDPRDGEVLDPLPGRLPPPAIVAIASVVATVAVALSVRPSMSGGWSLWLGMGIPYLVLGAYAVYLMYDDGTLLDRLTPRGGDFTLGVLVAAALLFASWTLRASVAPAGSPWQGWVLNVYLVLGNPSTIQRSAELTIVLLVIAALQELTWRGMVQDALDDRLGTRWGWIATAVLFALASAPTLFTLADTAAGLNPLLVVAALGCAMVWGFMTRVVGRILARDVLPHGVSLLLRRAVPHPGTDADSDVKRARTRASHGNYGAGQLH